MMNRANQNWPEDVIEINSDARDYSESFVDWALRIIDNALENRQIVRTVSGEVFTYNPWN